MPYLTTSSRVGAVSVLTPLYRSSDSCLLYCLESWPSLAAREPASFRKGTLNPNKNF